MIQLTCKAILFDLDGVLVDSAAAIEDDWRSWAESHDIDEQDVLRVVHGRRTEEIIRLVAPEMDAQAEAQRLQRTSDDEPDVDALPGARALLLDLPTTSWGIVTSGSRESAPIRLTGAGLPVPVVFVSAEAVESGKPEPDCWELAASLIGSTPSETIVFEDSPAGLLAAHRAGMTTIGVTTTHPVSELHHAHHQVTDLRDVTFTGVSDGWLAITLSCSPGFAAPGGARRE